MENKILIVDDNDQDIKIMKRYLGQAGYEDVVFSHTGEGGVDAVIKEKPDLVILDTSLPGIDGFEACKRIKSMRSEGPIVIIMTGLIDAVDAGKARKSGSDDYCVKTSDGTPILESVAKFLPRR